MLLLLIRELKTGEIGLHYEIAKQPFGLTFWEYARIELQNEIKAHRSAANLCKRFSIICRQLSKHLESDDIALLRREIPLIVRYEKVDNQR